MEIKKMILAIVQRIPTALDASTRVTGSFLFIVHGAFEGEWTIVVKDGDCEIYEGSIGEINTVIKIDAGNLMDAVSTKESLENLIIDEVIEVEGDRELAKRFLGDIEF